MESKINKVLLSRSTFYPERSEKLPEVGLMPLPTRYEKVNYWLVIFISHSYLYFHSSFIKYPMEATPRCSVLKTEAKMAQSTLLST